MITFHNPLHTLHQGKLEMFRGQLVPCFEVLARVAHVLAEIERRGLGSVRQPTAFDDSALTAIHTPRYLDFLAHAWDEWVALDPANAARDALPSLWPVRSFRSDVLPANFSARMGLFSFDAGTPLMAGTWTAARAGADFFGGYCFLNNAALAAQQLREQDAARVAVLDIDYHHGNGTQAIFYARSDVFFTSIHGDPNTEYPFYLGYADEQGEADGLGCNQNLPLPRGTGFAVWRAALAQALQGIARFSADALVVSLGLDTFDGDPVAGFQLQSDDYLRVGADIAAAGLPTVFVFEGGYAVAEVGVNAVNVLAGFGE